MKTAIFYLAWKCRRHRLGRFEGVKVGVAISSRSASVFQQGATPTLTPTYRLTQKKFAAQACFSSVHAHSNAHNFHARWKIL